MRLALLVTVTKRLFLRGKTHNFATGWYFTKAPLSETKRLSEAHSFFTRCYLTDHLRVFFRKDKHGGVIHSRTISCQVYFLFCGRVDRTGRDLKYGLMVLIPPHPSPSHHLRSHRFMRVFISCVVVFVKRSISIFGTFCLCGGRGVGMRLTHCIVR